MADEDRTSLWWRNGSSLSSRYFGEVGKQRSEEAHEALVGLCSRNGFACDRRCIQSCSRMTLNESVQHYCEPIRGLLLDADGIGRTYYLFKRKSCAISAFYLNGTTSRVVYTQKVVFLKTQSSAGIKLSPTFDLQFACATQPFSD